MSHIIPFAFISHCICYVILSFLQLVITIQHLFLNICSLVINFIPLYIYLVFVIGFCDYANLRSVCFRLVFMTVSSVTLAVRLFRESHIAWDEPS
jgi:hypothetical protein